MAKAVDTSWWRPGKVRAYAAIEQGSWHIGKKDSPYVLIIPAGKEFESSVPAYVPRWLFDRDDPRFQFPAYIHDALIEAGFDLDFCDSQWLAACRKVGAPRFKSQFARAMMLLRRYAQR